MLVCGAKLPAAEPAVQTGAETSLSRSYRVRDYVVEGKTLLGTNVLLPLLAKHTGTNVSVELVRAAADVQSEYLRQGYTAMNIVIAEKRITNGVVSMDVFPGAVAQIVVSGTRYWISTNGLDTAANYLPPTGWATLGGANGLAVKAAPARGTATNAGPRFKVEKYLVTGNTILPPATIGAALAGVTNAYGTNVSFEGIRAAVSELQEAYQSRGYVTVKVGLPQQKLTNATVKVQVTEGRLVTIEVKGNRYFSSNNVMRALPGLETNQFLNGLTFQEEVNRANANQDRQIYPIIGAGPDPGTSDLTLDIKDRVPLHGKVELNNQSSPGTPDLRVNSSAVYNNLWQQEHSLGVQYSFSPELYKQGPQWDCYDRPLVANYSGFYRLPLGGPDRIEEEVASQPGTFGYDEATRKFNLPPASGQPDVTFFASRSSIDTGLETLSSSVIYNVPGVRQVFESSVQQDLTENNDLGARLNTPLQATRSFHSDFSSGLDFKTYQISSYKTNNFVFTEITVNSQGLPNPPIKSTVASPVPATVRPLEYLPWSLRYNASLRDPLGLSTFGLGLGGNAWFSGSRSNLQSIAGSTKSAGHWVVLTPSFSRSLELGDWVTQFRADGQWASEPLISNEQFGAGGVNSVRGYHEGQVFGDTGWHVTLEQQTPPHRVGVVYGGVPLMIRGTLYTDYADTYLLDPQGRPASTALWGAGLGGVASIGSHWEARFLFSVPLLGTSTIEAYQPFFNFALTAQF
jgi:hemolysin activation/secretion protein